MRELQNKLDELKTNLDKEQQKNFDINSLQKNLLFYDKLNELNKPVVKKLLFEYFHLMEEKNYYIDNDTSTEISFKYILKIGDYYSQDLGFKVQMTLQYAIVVGLFLDSLILIISFPKNVYYTPLGSGIMLIYRAYLKVFYEKKIKYLD